MTETVHVRRTPDEVFDYTQDYAHRREWDSLVTSAQVLSEEPRRVRLTMSGLGTFTLAYKLFRRGGRTSAAFEIEKSPLFSGGGGSWDYAARADGTDWSQTSTVEFKNAFLGRLFGPMIRWNMRRSSLKAMNRARDIMESPEA